MTRRRSRRRRRRAARRAALTLTSVVVVAVAAATAGRLLDVFVTTVFRWLDYRASAGVVRDPVTVDDVNDTFAVDDADASPRLL